MHLKRIRATNFRAFGDGTSAPVLDWELSPGLNILVGENDAGKTPVIDAIRCALWTTSYEYIRLFETDFHICGAIRALTLCIEATLTDLRQEQEAAVLEWLTHEADGTRNLIIHLQVRWIPPKNNKRGRVDAITRSGRASSRSHSLSHHSSDQRRASG
jgi:putative ATP-dependent endonuclease of OLD family